MPRINAPASQRQAFYDRNASQVSKGSGAGASENEGTTELWTYTVPAAKKAMVTTMATFILGRVASTTTNTSDDLTVRCSITPSGGSEVHILRTNMQSDNVTPGATAQQSAGGESMLFAGDRLRSTYAYSGTAVGAGRARVDSGASVTEFDA